MVTTMKKPLGRIIDRYLNNRLDFRVRLFNVLALAGTLVSLISAVVSLIIGDPVGEAALYMLFCLLAAGLLFYSTKTGRYMLCYRITISVIFLIGFPLFFVADGGSYGAMPYFFIFAIVFTVFMLEGKSAVIFAALEMALYTALCAAAPIYFPPRAKSMEIESVTFETIFGFLTVGAALGISLLLHFKLYNEQQRELAERNAELDRINRRKTEFLSNISHELKTPLTVVSSHIQVAQKELEKHRELEEMLNTAKLIGSEVERMGIMVAQLLDVSRIDEGRMRIEPRRESIIEIIQATLNTYYPVFSKNRNRLAFNRTDEVPAVRCDRTRVMQVLVNLISNATQHTRGGEITVSADVLGGDALVTVSDTGDGIDSESMQNLFKRYHSRNTASGKSSRPGWDTGTGLGLFICKHIVEEHGGRIWVESEPGKGTRARFTLPPDT